MIPVFMAFDKKLEKYYHHVFNSIIQNSSIDVELNIICEMNVNIIDPKWPIKVHKVEPNIMSEFKYGSVTSRAMFLRWMIPDLTESDKALYFDNDLVVLGDVAELAGIDMGNYLIAAVPNYCQKKVSQTFFMQGQCPIGGENEAYLSGQLVINCDAWRREGITDVLNKFVKQYGVLDEAAINIICADRIYKLDHHWCCPANMVDENYNPDRYKYAQYPPRFEWEWDNVKLLHWAGKLKPWYGQSKNLEYYKKYL